MDGDKQIESIKRPTLPRKNQVESQRLKPLDLPVLDDTSPLSQSNTSFNETFGNEINAPDTCTSSSVDFNSSPETKDCGAIALPQSEDIPCPTNSEHSQEQFVSSNFSPASPRREDTMPQSNRPTPIIPSNNKISETSSRANTAENSNYIVDNIIRNYSYASQSVIRADPLKAKEPIEITRLLASLHINMKSYVSSPEWTSAEVDVCVSTLLHQTQRPKILARLIIETVQQIRSETFCTKFTPPAPILRPTDQRCLVLVLRIAKHMPGFDKYLQLDIERQVFKLIRPLTAEAIINLIYFLIALYDADSDVNQIVKIRLLIYKSMYYHKRLARPLVFAILMAFPSALPHSTKIENCADPLIWAFASVLTNDSYTGDKGVYKSDEMFYFLKIHYGYFAMTQFRYDETIDYCIECIRRNQLQNVDYALILMSKRKGWEWAIRSIVDGHLVPMLSNYVAEIETGDYDNRIQTIVFTIASIIKTIPYEHNIDAYLNTFSSLLNITKRKFIQESVVLAFCQLARFGYKNIYTRIAKWEPDYEVASNVLAALSTFVHNKGKRFWL